MTTFKKDFLDIVEAVVTDEEYYGAYYDYQTRTDGLIGLPSQHGTSNDEQAPLGTGAMLLIGFGAAYAMKKRKEA